MTGVLRVRYLSTAVRDLAGIRKRIANDNPRAAADVLAAIQDFVNPLATVPEAGHLVGRGDIRMAVVPRLPYLVFYRPLTAELRVRHGRRRPLSWA